jgi:membrane-bound metal-dependent hydrolase YbcI (DUF457 family)
MATFAIWLGDSPESDSNLVACPAMPSPVGHALGGLAAGWLASGSGKLDRPLTTAVLIAALGAVPDVDVLVEGTHRLYTHSLVAVALVGLTVALSPARLGFSRARFALVCAAAYGSHLLLDWLGDDRSVPIGIRALWPFTDGYYQSSLLLFPPVERRYWLPGFWTANLRAIGWELAVMTMPVIAAGVVRWRRARAPRN